jgi:integrase
MRRVPAPISTPIPTLAAYTVTWLAAIHGTVRPQTHRNYANVLRRYVLPTLGAIPLDALSRRDVRDCLATQLAAGRAPQTVAGAHAVLHMLLNFAIDDELVVQNVSRGLARRLHRSVRPRTTLDVRQLELFLATAAVVTPKQYPLFVGLAAGGLRIGEAIGLRPEDIERDAPVIHVRRTIHAGGHPGPTKSGRTRRVLVTEPAAAILRAVPSGPTGWLFPARRGPRPVSAQHIQNLTAKVAAVAGLPAITPKTFRRSYASAIRTIGASVAFTADQLGHLTESTTRQFYLDGAPRALPPDGLRR